MWYKFSENKPKVGDDVIMYSSMTDSIASGIYNDKMCNQSVFDYWSLTPGKDVLVPKCLQPTPADYPKSTWYSYKEEKPEDGAYIIIRLDDGRYGEGKFNKENNKVFLFNTCHYWELSTCFWSYLPKEFIEEGKGEIHIWLDYSGCMPKACYSTYTSTKDAIKNKEKYINTTQTKLCVDDLIEQNYRVFVHAGNKKKEITSDFQINMVIEEWNI